jgi:hypothetical protein
MEDAVRCGWFIPGSGFPVPIPVGEQRLQLQRRSGRGVLEKGVERWRLRASTNKVHFGDECRMSARPLSTHPKKPAGETPSRRLGVEGGALGPAKPGLLLVIGK